VRLANVLVVQIKSPPARNAAALLRDGGVLLFVCLYVCLQRRVLIVSIVACYCVRCDLLLPSTNVMAGPFTTQ